MESASTDHEVKIASLNMRLSLMDSISDGVISQRFRVNDYIYRNVKYIRDTRKRIAELRLSPGEYHESFPQFAYELLSLCPYNTKAHLSKLFQVSPEVLDDWILEYNEYSDSVKRGMAEGEVLARSILLESSVEPGAMVNTSLLQTLSNNVYAIKDEHTIDIAEKPINQLIAALHEMRHGEVDPADLE